MAFTRTTIIDASPTGDSVRQAILDLDADLTGAFTGLNQLLASLAGKVSQTEYDQPSGVPRLDSAGLLKAVQLPSTLKDTPIGIIAPFGMQALPADCNWLECDGAELAIVDYPALYGAIGTLFGFASDAAKFKLPDLRGRFLRGWSHGSGVDPDATSRVRGDTVGSSQGFDTVKHAHVVGATNGYSTAGGLSSINPGTRGGATAEGTKDFDPSQYPESELLARGGVAGKETRPLNTAVMYCIKWR